MDIQTTSLTQQTLFEVEEIKPAQIELFPAVWRVTERLSAPEAAMRLDSLERLSAMNAPRVSPLVAYMIATRLTDPDLQVRFSVVRILGEILVPDKEGYTSHPDVRRHLSAQLSRMRRRSIFALLEVAVTHAEAEEHVVRLLNLCPFAGNSLASILADRTLPLSIRRQAVHFLGEVGYLDAIPALERLLIRLQSRLSGQRKMPFAPVADPDEEAVLLPEIQGVLRLLRAS
ncbi:MAG: hypothetical protein AB1345_08345 [Chloroflexota bacterium]